MRKFVNVHCLALLASCTAGCTDEDLGFAERSAIVCPSEFRRYVDVDGTPVADLVRNTPIDLTGVQEILDQTPGLADYAAVSEVSTCADASWVLSARLELAESFPPDDALEDEGESENVGQESEFRIKQAQGIEGHPGAVEIIVGPVGGPLGSCSGTLISPAAAVLSAHCVDHMLSPSNPNDEVDWGVGAVSYRRRFPSSGETDWICLTGGPTLPNGKCSSAQQLAVVMYGPYVGGTDTESDIALVVKPTDWNGIATGALIRIWTDALAGYHANNGFDMWARGVDSDAGTGGGVMRRGGFGLDWYGTHHFFAYQRTPHVCDGDSGGGALSRELDPEKALGILSNSEGGGACTVDGGKQRWTRLNTKLNWIHSWLLAFGKPGCTEFTDGTTGLKYHRCW